MDDNVAFSYIIKNEKDIKKILNDADSPALENEHHTEALTVH